MKLGILIVNNLIKNIFKKEKIAKPKISESVVKNN